VGNHYARRIRLNPKRRWRLSRSRTGGQLGGRTIGVEPARPSQPHRRTENFTKGARYAHCRCAAPLLPSGFQAATISTMKCSWRKPKAISSVGMRVAAAPQSIPSRAERINGAVGGTAKVAMADMITSPLVPMPGRVGASWRVCARCLRRKRAPECYPWVTSARRGPRGSVRSHPTPRPVKASNKCQGLRGSFVQSGAEEPEKEAI